MISLVIFTSDINVHLSKTKLGKNVPVCNLSCGCYIEVISFRLCIVPAEEVFSVPHFYHTNTLWQRECPVVMEFFWGLLSKQSKYVHKSLYISVLYDLICWNMLVLIKTVYWSPQVKPISLGWPEFRAASLQLFFVTFHICIFVYCSV